MKSSGLLVVGLFLLPLCSLQEETCMESEQGKTRIVVMVTPYSGYVEICHNINESSYSDEYRWFSVRDSTWNTFGAEYVCREAGFNSSGTDVWVAAGAAEVPETNGSCFICPMRFHCNVDDIEPCYGHPAFVICNLTMSQLEGKQRQCDSTQSVQNTVTISANTAAAAAVTSPDAIFTSSMPDNAASLAATTVFATSNVTDNATPTLTAISAPPTTSNTITVTSITTVTPSCTFDNTATSSTSTSTSSPAPVTSFITITTTSTTAAPSCAPRNTSMNVFTISMSCMTDSAANTYVTLSTSASGMAVNTAMIPTAATSTVTIVSTMILPQSSSSSYTTFSSIAIVIEPTPSSSSITWSSIAIVSVVSGKLDQCASLGGVLGAMIVVMAMAILGMLIGWVWTCHRRADKKKLHFHGVYDNINQSLNRRRGGGALTSISSITPIMLGRIDSEDSPSSPAMYDVIQDHQYVTETSRRREEEKTPESNQGEVIYHVLEPEAGRTREASVSTENSESEPPQDYEVPLKIKVTPPSEDETSEDETSEL